MGGAREHGITNAITEAGVTMIADTTYQGGGPAIRVVQRPRRIDPDTGPVPHPKDIPMLPAALSDGLVVREIPSG